MEGSFNDSLVNEKVLYNALNDFLVGLSGAKESQTIIDKNRGWFARSKLLKNINSTRKHILLIRDIRYCMASWEELFRNNNTHRAYNLLFPEGFERFTLSQRVDSHLDATNPNLGYWVNYLCEILENEPNVLEDEDILIVKFEDLISNFNVEINKIYDFIGLESNLYKKDPYSEDLTKDSMNNFRFPLHAGSSIVFENKQENLDDYFSQKVSDYIINKYRVFYEKFYPQVLAGEM
jgi:hypothetical protein